MEDQDVVVEQVENEDIAPQPDEDGFVFDATRFDDGWTEEQVKLVHDREKETFHLRKKFNEHTAEVGESRKRNQELTSRQAELQRELELYKKQEEEIDDDPTALKENLRKQTAKEIELESLRAQSNAYTIDNSIKEKYPDFDEVINSEGVEFLRATLSNSGHNEFSINAAINELTSGAWKTKDSATVDSVMTIYKEARFLKANKMIEELKTGKTLNTQDALDQVAKNIQKVAGHKPTNMGGVSYSSKKIYSPSELSSMSAEEVKAQLKERIEKNRRS